MIHIEGMGWLGAATAFRLHAEHIPFTWNDIDAPHVAWKAAYGAIPPGGDDRTRVNLHRWADHTAVFPAGTVIPAVFAYTSPHPPFGGNYRPRYNLGWCRLANLPTYAVDPHAIVTTARTQFANHRTDGPEPGQPTIVAHGHTARRSRWIWGWSMPVRLDLPHTLLSVTDGLNVTFYDRYHRFTAAHAVPIPTRPGWWMAGSAYMPQRKPHPLNLDSYVDRWLHRMQTTYPNLRVLEHGEPRHGWRPQAHPGDTLTVHRDGERLIYPPLAVNGLTWAPTLTDQAAGWAAARTYATV